MSNQRTFLFAWNPKKYPWEISKRKVESWSCASYRRAQVGDKFFMTRVGSKPKGIFASGKIVSSPKKGKHWADKSKETFYVGIDYDVLLDPKTENILGLNELTTGNLGMQNWVPQSSGILIDPSVVDELEVMWFRFLNKYEFQGAPNSEIADQPSVYIEGTTRQVIQTRYERNPHARKACLKHYGYSCAVCGFNFEECYGRIGHKFIHVHHLTQLSSRKKKHELNPIEDLRPVCPNCHAMLHKRKIPLTIEELKQMINT